ncbi:hypothetical protein J7T55_012011 [Diaporthe amygdali]|uniref:uncharacterized protein n=1 Tax=Phomopsis amygdali TaxID=1214568 RepID=UPI0022FDB78D|nr:uncharacterized protein J7T55_012011 [Diaporthe amygdali]KAJ0123546.1 hypothetical protein J7T55_012011 [Diaporthe amygdali]
MAAPIPEFKDDFMRLAVSPNSDGAVIPSTLPAAAMPAPLPEFKDDFMRLTVSPNSDGAVIPPTLPATAMPASIPEFPDDYTCLQAMEHADTKLFDQWEGIMRNRGQYITFVLKPEITPADVALCPVHVRVPRGYNNMPDKNEKVGRLWLENRHAGITGNSVAFPIETQDQLGKNFVDFIFTNIAISGPPGRYRFFFQVMVKDETAPARWTMWARMTSSGIEVNRYIYFGGFVDNIDHQTLNLSCLHWVVRQYFPDSSRIYALPSILLSLCPAFQQCVPEPPQDVLIRDSVYMGHRCDHSSKPLQASELAWLASTKGLPPAAADLVTLSNRRPHQNIPEVRQRAPVLMPRPGKALGYDRVLEKVQISTVAFSPECGNRPYAFNIQAAPQPAGWPRGLRRHWRLKRQLPRAMTGDEGSKQVSRPGQAGQVRGLVATGSRILRPVQKRPSRPIWWSGNACDRAKPGGAADGSETS